MDKKIVLSVIMGVFVSILLVRSQIVARYSTKYMAERDAELSYFEDDQFLQESGFDLLSSLAVNDMYYQVEKEQEQAEEEPLESQDDVVSPEVSVAQNEPKIEPQLKTLATQDSQVEEVKSTSAPVAPVMTVSEPSTKSLPQ